MLPLAVNVPETVKALLARIAALAVIGAELENVVAALKVTGALAVISAFAVNCADEVKVVGELIVTVLVASVPRTTFPLAARVLPALTVTAALAVTGPAKVLAAFTVRLWAEVVPKIELPVAVRLLAVLLRVTLPEKVARPVLSMMRRSVSWPVLLVLLLPAVVVLRVRPPPQLPLTSCNMHHRCWCMQRGSPLTPHVQVKVDSNV